MLLLTRDDCLPAQRVQRDWNAATAPTQMTNICTRAELYLFQAYQCQRGTYSYCKVTSERIGRCQHTGDVAQSDADIMHTRSTCPRLTHAYSTQLYDSVRNYKCLKGEDR